MDVGREIRRLREEKGWSQAKLAGAADMGTSGISQIETGARNPSAVTLSKIAEALGVGVADLFPKGQPTLPLDLEQRRETAQHLTEGGVSEPIARGVSGVDHRSEGYWRALAEASDLEGDLKDQWHSNSFSFEEARKSLESYCEHWEAVLAEDNLDEHAAQELITTAHGWIPVLDIAVNAEMNAIAVSGERKQSEIAEANRRYLKLFSAAIEVFQERVERDQYESITMETNVVNLQKARDRVAELPSQAVG